jgi:cyanophycinase-like exopeptidase
MTRLLVIMGSGETAPTMVKPHRAIFDRIGAAPAVMLDTPYGFQENADDISTRAIGYFAASVGRNISVASWRDRDIEGAARERALAAMRGAGWLFAGPGSPTYALTHWRDTPIPQIITDRLRTSGAVVFASAAALTLGSHTVPVYEIYKVGASPDWVEGLDILRDMTGLPAVVIPHYDNAEGGHHDTRFCYLGERRLSMMEARLPDDSFILGVDEHTAVVLDLDACTASVLGNGVLTIRRRGDSVSYPGGVTIGFDELTDPGKGPVPGAPVPTSAATHDVSSLTHDAEVASSAFDRAVALGDVEASVNAILQLEQALVDWAADTEETDDPDAARAQLRSMIVKLGDLVEAGMPDRDDPFIDLIVTERTRAREAGDYAASDRIRSALTSLGIEVRDTPEGPVWRRD